jgi:ABC-type sugar transport system ATPase subunit
VLDIRHRKTVTVGVRPQHLSLFPGAGKESLSANVSVFEFLGEIGNLTVSSNDMDLNVLAPPDFDTLEEKTLQTYYDPKRIFLFDSVTEKNLFFEMV